VILLGGCLTCEELSGGFSQEMVEVASTTHVDIIEEYILEVKNTNK
jgi:hypothetical protein